MPKYGYTNMISYMLTHNKIHIKFNSTITDFNEIPHDILIYTAGFDNLPYRSTKFTFKIKKTGQYAVVNTPQHPTQTRYTNFNILHPLNDYSIEEKNVYCYETPAEINQYNGHLISYFSNINNFKKLIKSKDEPDFESEHLKLFKTDKVSAIKSALEWKNLKKIIIVTYYFMQNE